MTVQCTLSLIHNNKILTTEFPDNQQPSIDRWMSFDGTTTITDEPGPGLGPQVARLNEELLCTEKGEKEGSLTILLLIQGLYALARRQEMLFTWNFLNFLLIE